MSMPLSEVSGPADRDASAEEVLDADALARLRELDPKGTSGLLGRVLQAFESSSARLLPQLRSAQHAGDSAAARYVAHTLKSSSASIGAVRLSQLCAELENGIRLQQPVDLPTKVEGIERELGRVLQALAGLPDQRR